MKKKNLRVQAARRIVPMVAGVLSLVGCGNHSGAYDNGGDDAVHTDTVRVVGMFPYSFNSYNQTAYYVHTMKMNGEYMAFPVLSKEIAKRAIQNQDTIVVSRKVHNPSRVFDVCIEDNLSFKNMLNTEKQR